MFTSWGGETARKFTDDEIRTILTTLSEDTSCGEVLRAKGMLDGADGTWIYFDMVPGECDIRPGAPDITGRFCVIGAHLNEEKLKALFRM